MSVPSGWPDGLDAELELEDILGVLPPSPRRASLQADPSATVFDEFFLSLPSGSSVGASRLARGGRRELSEDERARAPQLLAQTAPVTERKHFYRTEVYQVQDCLLACDAKPKVMDVYKIN